MLFLLAITVNAKDTLFLLPQESKQAEQKIEELIKSSQQSIEVAMYNFSLKSLAQELIQAKKRGLEVKVFLDEEKSKDKSSEYKLLKKNGVDVILIGHTKLHTKLAIFDKKVAVFGSSNWTKESFDKNYEIIVVSQQDDMLKKLNQFIKQLKEK